MRLDERIKHLSGAAHRMPVLGFDETHKFYKANGGWFFFLNNKLPRRQRPCGWKFHISISNSSLNEIWHYLEPYLLSNEKGILCCKVINQQETYCMSGKHIVLYTFIDSNGKSIQSAIEIFNLLLKIESILRLHHVVPGERPKSSLKVSGSRYFSIRHDIDMETNQYISNDMAKLINESSPYNPFEYENPYRSFNFCDIRGRFFSPRMNIFTKSQNFYSYSPEDVDDRCIAPTY